MSLRRLLPCFLILTAALLPMLASSQAKRPALWFEGARLIIGDKSPTIESSAFLIEGDSFTWVGKKEERQPPANATRVDLTGKTVIPTLIDGHDEHGPGGRSGAGVQASRRSHPECGEIPDRWKRHRGDLDGGSADRSARRHSVRRGDPRRRPPARSGVACPGRPFRQVLGGRP